MMPSNPLRPVLVTFLIGIGGWTLHGQVTFKSGAKATAGTRVGNSVVGGDALSQPLITADDLSYLGCFSLPDPTSRGQGGNGGAPGPMTAAAFYAPHHSMFINMKCKSDECTTHTAGGGNAAGLAEVLIPEHTDLSSQCLPGVFTTTYVQPMVEPSEGAIETACTTDQDGAPDPCNYSGVYISGIRIVSGTTIQLSYQGYYDSSCLEKHVFGYRPIDLSDTGHFTGLFTLAGGGCARTVNGQMYPVPTGWDSLLGYDTLQGTGMLSIISNTNAGYSAYGRNTASFASGFALATFADAPCQIVGSNCTTPPGSPVYVNGAYGSARFHGGDWIPGTRTIVLPIGRFGSGTPFYAEADSNTRGHGAVNVHQGTTGEFSGSDASTSNGGCRVTLPNVTFNTDLDIWIQLTSQTTPVGFIDPLHPTWYEGTMTVQSNGWHNSGAADAYVDLNCAGGNHFTDGLTGQNYLIGYAFVYDPENSAKGYHGYPYQGKLYLMDAKDLYESAVTPGDGSALNGAWLPYDEFHTSQADGNESDVRAAIFDSTNDDLLVFNNASSCVFVYHVSNVP